MTLPKLKNWYHATSVETAEKILEQGYLVPQTPAGVWFANSGENAGMWANLRGLKEYVVFKIPRTRLNTSDIVEGNIHSKNFDSVNMVTMRYINVIKVSQQDATLVNDKRTFDIPGCEWFTEGTKRLGIKITDREKFEEYCQNTPEIWEKLQAEGAML